ncbi:Uncharacterized protein HZ326_10715 [Fusarium oxysporum f. sp. albedinis]|nr:Uncharacterized protein HZ326_10715 [Fusarium oxysporum f. sp. albedinis]
MSSPNHSSDQKRIQRNLEQLRAVIMTGPDTIKQRRAQPENPNGAKQPMANLSPITRNVTRHDISEWRQDNKYIFAGYCPLEAGYLQYLIGAILLPLFATAILQTIYRPQHINIIRTDFIIFTIFFYSGESCLIFSAVYDLIRSHLYKVEYTFIPGTIICYLDHLDIPSAVRGNKSSKHTNQVIRLYFADLP